MLPSTSTPQVSPYAMVPFQPMMPNPWMYMMPPPFWNPQIAAAHHAAQMNYQVARMNPPPTPPFYHSLPQVKAYLDTKLIIYPDLQKISADMKQWLQVSGTSHEKFSEVILNLSPMSFQHILSNTGAWGWLKPVGKSAYTRMYNWLNFQESIKVHVMALLENEKNLTIPEQLGTSKGTVPIAMPSAEMLMRDVPQESSEISTPVERVTKRKAPPEETPTKKARSVEETDH